MLAKPRCLMIATYFIEELNGFNKVFNIESLKCFSDTELEEVICGCEDDNWDYNNLMENIIPSHGLDKNSLMFQGLLQIMLDMNKMVCECDVVLLFCFVYVTV